MLGITFSFLRPRLIFSQACWGKARSALARRRPAGEQRIEGAQSRSFNIAWQHETGHDHKVAIDMVVNGKFNCRIGNSNCRNPADSAQPGGKSVHFSALPPVRLQAQYANLPAINRKEVPDALSALTLWINDRTVRNSETILMLIGAVVSYRAGGLRT
jgi:hypothetical protein